MPSCGRLGSVLAMQVILPGFTCVVVPNAIRLAGARPIYADIPENSYNIDPAGILQVITSRTKAIIVQHTFGIPACLDEITSIARERDLWVVEDCAHALGSSYAGKHVGLWGDAAFFSTQWSKPFTTGLGRGCNHGSCSSSWTCTIAGGASTSTCICKV